MASTTKESNVQKLSNLKAIKFLDLNDDCIFAIFEKLSIADLGSMSITCKRLNELASSFFLRKHPNERITIRQKYAQLLIDENHLKYFTKLIKNIRIKSGRIDIQYVFDIVSTKFCENLDSLELETSLQFQKNDGAAIATQLSTIKHLKVENSRKKSDIFNGLLKYCKNLKDLTIMPICDTDNKNNWFYHSYPTVESLTIAASERDNYKPFQKIAYDFLQRNPQLKQLKFTYEAKSTIKIWLNKGEINRFSLIYLGYMTNTKSSVIEDVKIFTKNALCAGQKTIQWFEIGFPININLSDTIGSTTIHYINLNEILPATFAINSFQPIHCLDILIIYHSKRAELLDNAQFDEDYEDIKVRNAVNTNLNQFLNDISMRLLHLEKVTLTVSFHNQCSFKEIVKPLVCNLKKLKELNLIKMAGSFEHYQYDLIELNTDRKLLKDASRIQIKANGINNSAFITSDNSLIDFQTIH